MGDMRIFKSSYSKGYLLTTVLMVAFIVNIIWGAAYQMTIVPIGTPRFYWMAFSLVLFSYLPIYCFLSQIVSVNVDDERVIIQKKLGQIVLSRSEIVKVELAPKSRSTVNLFSLRGLFGSVGWFRNKELGTYFALVNNDKETVVIKTTRRTYVVSCNDREEMVSLFS